MKKNYYLILISFLLMIAYLFTSLKTNEVYALNEYDSKITVYGTSEVQVVPDTVIISMGVENTSKSLTDAESENSYKVNNIINILVDYGIEKEHIKTRNFSVYPKYDFSNGQSFLDYQISNYIDFKTKNIENISEVIAQLTEVGANHFNGISFSLENSDEAYSQALEQAINNAWNKAYSMIGNNIELYIIDITEESVYSNYRGFFDNYTAKSSSENSIIMQGEINIKANVRVVFGYNKTITTTETNEQYL